MNSTMTDKVFAAKDWTGTLEKGSELILVVDDMELNRERLVDEIELMGYQSVEAANGAEALKQVEAQTPDLILLDLMMPVLDGHGVLEALSSNSTWSRIPTVVVSGMDDMDSLTRCLEEGATDYLVKPVKSRLLRARIENCLAGVRLRKRDEEAQAIAERYNAELERRVADQVKEIADAHISTIFALSTLAESRDPETGAHLDRMREYCRSLADALRQMPEYKDMVDDEFVENIYAASPLHDIGKVGIPDKVLLKPGKLDDSEFRIMKEHSQIGADTLRRVSEKYPNNALIQMGIEIAQSHHEKWNGTGYPHGLSGARIPLASRILALCDVYDALTCRRCYKEPFSHDKSASIILAERGEHFDPDLVDVFATIQTEFNQIRERLQEDL